MTIFAMAVLVSGTYVFAAPAVEIAVYADKEQAAPGDLQGFLTGIGYASKDQFDQERVAALRPRSWRIPDWGYYDKIRPFHPQITFILGEQYVNLKGGWDKAKPWENWVEWELYVKKCIEYSKNNHKPVDFWDIWGEPDLAGGTSWKGTYSQFLEFCARTIKTVHSVDPDAKVVGPSVSDFHPRFKEGAKAVAGLDRFLVDLNKRHGVLPDVISWHELGSLPEDVPAHVQTLRAFLKTAFPGYNPLFHINEFTSQPEHLIPGWTVGWLYYLEQSGINSANRACWNVQVPFARQWSNCWAGLNGLLLNDNKTPQMLYWVHLAYANINQNRIATKTSDPRTVVIAGKEEVSGEIRLLVGRFESRSRIKGPNKNVAIKIQGYPRRISSAHVSAQRFENNGLGMAVAEKPKTISKDIAVQGGIITFQEPNFQDGDAYFVTIKPAP